MILHLQVVIGLVLYSPKPPVERYAVTEWKMLALVWIMSHSHQHLYTHDFTVITDHSAVKAVLNIPGGSCKHALWLKKLYEETIWKLNIVYRTCKENTNADALSRQDLIPTLAGVIAYILYISQSRN